jgi:hypothetical protein
VSELLSSVLYIHLRVVSFFLNVSLNNIVFSQMLLLTTQGLHLKAIISLQKFCLNTF